jgi:HNH endonuclease
VSTQQGRELLLEAVRRGYRVDTEGNAFGPTGRKLSRRVGSGYYAIGLKVEGRPMNVELHRIAAFQLYGEAVFAEGIEVRHLDGNCSNNAATNLVLGTPSQNSMDRSPEQRRAMAEHASLRRRRLTDAEENALCEDRRAGMEFRALAAKFEISVGAAHYIWQKHASRKSLDAVPAPT